MQIPGNVTMVNKVIFPYFSFIFTANYFQFSWAFSVTGFWLLAGENECVENSLKSPWPRAQCWAGHRSLQTSNRGHYCPPVHRGYRGHRGHGLPCSVLGLAPWQYAGAILNNSDDENYTLSILFLTKIFNVLYMFTFRWKKVST